MVAAPSSTWNNIFFCRNGASKMHHFWALSISNSRIPVVNYAYLRHRRNYRSNFKGVGVVKKSLTTAGDDDQCSDSEEADNSSNTSGGGGETPVIAEQTTNTKTNNGILAAAIQRLPLSLGEANSAIISACLVGLLTGFSVVLFNNAVCKP